MTRVQFVFFIMLTVVGFAILASQRKQDAPGPEQARTIIDLGGIETIAPSLNTRLEEAFWVIAQIESNCDPKAFRKERGEAGILQILPSNKKFPGALDEANRILGWNKFSDDDRWSVGSSREIFMINMKHHLPNGSLEQWCRMWNRGTSKKYQYDSHGDAYWAKAKRIRNRKGART